MFFTCKLNGSFVDLVYLNDTVYNSAMRKTIDLKDLDLSTVSVKKIKDVRFKNLMSFQLALKLFQLREGSDKHVLQLDQDINNKDFIKLRCNLIEEETKELIEALNEEPSEDKIDHVLKEFEDLLYVTIGTLVAIDIRSDYQAMMRVHDNNMSKLGLGAYIREDGKLIKPPGFTSELKNLRE